MAQATEYGDIEIVRADEKGILFEFRPVNVRLEMAASSNSSLARRPAQRLAISNCGRTAAMGGYDLPVRIVLIGIPAEARPEVTALANGESSFPVADAAMNGRTVNGERLKAEDNSALDEEKAGMTNRVVPDRPFWIGNQRVLRLKLFPARYDETAKAYRVVEKLQVEVRLNSLENFVSSSASNAWEKVLRSGLLNYEQAKGFRRRPEQSGRLAKSATFSSPFGQSQNWVKVTFNENGIYKIDRNMLSAAGVPVSSIDPRTIRMFCQGGRALPAFNNVPRPAWRELAIEVTGEQDGIFDAGNQIRFYGWGAEGWDYDTLNGTFSFGKNNYTVSQTFWLTWDGTFSGSASRVDSQNVPPTGALPVVTSFPARFRLEQDRFLAVDNGSEINDYYNWYGGKGNNQTYFFTLPDLVQNVDTIKIGHLSSPSGISLRVNGRLASVISSAFRLTVFQTDTLKAGLNRVDLTLGTTSNGFNHFDFFETHYNRTPVYSAPLMEFETPTASGTVRFQISGTPQNFILWDITNRSIPITLNGAVRDGSGVLSFGVDASAKRIFALTSTADFKQPALMRQTLVDLTGSNQGEFILIAPAAFRTVLSSYAAHRASYSGVAVRQVDIEQIYNNFAGGLPDPIAIRDFLKFTRENWSDPKPRFVLLVGDATYDFRNLTGAGGVNYVAPFIVDPTFDASSLGPSNSDEGFLFFGNPGILDSADQFLDMTIARWPVKNVSELQVIADKIRNYEASPEYGVWRNRVTLVADDEFVGNDGPPDQEFHTTQAEKMDSLHLPLRFDRKKIYLFDYPFDGLRQKPEAEEAIVKAWNDGHLLIDYIGHGNPNVWAHERVFKREEDVPRLVNDAKLPLVYAASCNINTFVEPLADGMGEDLMKNPSGGAVAVIAAVRVVFSGANTDLNNKVFDLLFGSDSLSIGEAFYLAKLLRQYLLTEPNDRRYVLFGDPAMHLARPTFNINLNLQPDSLSLSALGVAVVSGTVADSTFNGTVQLTVFDGLRKRSHPLAGDPDRSVKYKLPGNMIYRGKASVSAGRFQITFVVPKDISYGDSTGRISAYAWNASGDAAGFKDSIILSGSAVAANDTVGPKISLAASGGASLQPGDPVSAGVPLSVKLEDSSGINITGDPAHTITADFDFPSGPGLDLTEAFRYEPGSFARGEAAFSMPQLSAGRHTLRVKAWDGANNSSVLEMPVEAVSSEKLKLSGVLNYPNPMKDTTNFCYTLSAPADEVIIEIFSLAGRPVRTIRSASTRSGYNFDTAWDGRDNDGDRVASGVYLYKIRARQASKESEEFGKLVVMR